MGMCSERQKYVMRILKEVPGEDNRFVVAHTVPSTMISAQANYKMQEVMLAALCNDNRDARIKFVLVNPSSNFVFHEAITSVKALEEGKTTLECGHGGSLRFDNFKVMEKPHFTDYLRSGWQIGLTIAIDYTASNHSDNLHGLGP